MVVGKEQGQRYPGAEEWQGGDQVEGGQGDQQPGRHAGVVKTLLERLEERLVEECQHLEADVRLEAEQHEDAEEQGHGQPAQHRPAGGDQSRVRASAIACDSNLPEAKRRR